MDEEPEAARGEPSEPSRVGRRRVVVTLLFTDVIGSVALKQKLGDQAGIALIQEHHAVIRQTLALSADAREVETAGDSFLVCFSTPSEAVRHALLLRARLAAFNREHATAVADRIGVHMGEVDITERESGRVGVCGMQVDTCARVMSLAEGGQVLLTRPVFDNARQSLKGEAIPGCGPLNWLNHGWYRLKGIDEPVEICEVRSGDSGPATPPTSSDKAERVAAEGEPVLGWRPALGQVVPNTQWVLDDKLGEGGFGEVWLASHRQLKEQRVFKFCFLADRVRSLKREVTLFRLLKERAGAHPNIVLLYDVCFEQPPFYLVEEYVNGRDLRRWSEKQGGIGQVPLEARLEIVAQAAAALQAAHDAGIIHRDVKPGNILVGGQWASADGPSTLRVKLTDFGIAQIVSSGVLAGITRAGFTQAQMFPDSSHTGTQLYMAPELMAGKPASTRSDIYALGVVLYQLLVGDFDRPVTTEWPGDVLDPLLRDDLKHCFAGNPNDRFAGAGQLAERLGSLTQRRRALLEQQAHLAARERAAYRRGMLRTAAIASVIVAVIAVLGWQVRSSALVKFRQAARIRSTTVRLTVANGLNPANSGDWLSAGLWFAEAFVLDETFQAASDAPLNRQTHRLRLNSVFRQSPRLEQVWFDETNPSAGPDLPGQRVLPTGQGEDLGSCVCGGFDLAGKHILLGGINGYRLYSIASGQPASPCIGEGSTRASLRPDGRRAVTGSGATNFLFTLWDVASGARLFNLHAPSGDEPFRGDCTDVKFSPDGRWIAAAMAGPRGQVMIWDADTGRARPPIAYADAPNVGWTNGNSILTARFDPSGERLLTTGTDNRAVVWEWRTGRALQVLPGHHSWVYGGSFGHRHTNWVVTCSFDRTARLWDLRTGQQFLQVEHEGDAILDVQFSPDDRVFATCGLDSTVRLWDSATGQLIPPIIRDHGRTTQVQWSPDGTRLLTISWDGVARLWRLRADKPVMESTGTDYSRDGRYALSLDRDTVRVREARTDVNVTALRLAPSEAAYCVAGAPGELLCFSRPAGSTPAGPCRVQLWRVSQHSPVGLPLAYDPRWSRWQCAPAGQRFAFYSGRTLGIGEGSEQGVFVWEPARASEPRMLAFTNEDVTSVAFDPDGRRLGVASLDRTSQGGVLRLIDLEANQKATVLLRSGQQIPHVTFSGDGQWLAAAQSDPTLAPGDAVLWRLTQPAPRSFNEVARLVHLDGVLWTAFSDSSHTIATGSEDQTAILWQWTRGAWQASPRPLRCGGQVYACCFSHNGRWLATAYWTPGVQQSEMWRSGLRIWDVTHSEPVSLPIPFAERVTRLAFVADDTRLFVEHWIPPAPPQRWIIDLAVNDGSAEQFLLRAELLSAQRSFLSGQARHIPQTPHDALPAEDALARATSVGPLRPLSKEDCRDLWLNLSSGVSPPPHTEIGCHVSSER